jgi:hypothetical protein
MTEATERDAALAVQRQTELLQHLGEAYKESLDEQMGQLHNQFVTFISVSRLPLPQVLLVLEILVSETIAQAKARYLGGA